MIENSIYFENITNDPSCLFIFDEAHMTGGVKVSEALDKILELYPKCHLLGATATPERSDYFNIRYHFFDGIETSKYSLNDAINDGIFCKPYYVYSLFEINKNFEKIKKKVESSDLSKNKKVELSKMIKSSEMKYTNIYNEANVIKNAIETANHDTNYMKYIAFFSDMKTMYSKIDNIVGNFKSIFPDHSIRSLIIASDTTEHRKNVEEIQKLKNKNNTIDLDRKSTRLNSSHL